MPFALILSFAISAATPTAAEEHLRTATPGAPPPKARVEDLRWMVGHWEGKGLGGQSFETISPPVAGQMAGHFQQVRNGRLSFYELYQFVPSGQSLVLRIKHFGPDLAGREERGEAAEFPLVAISADAAYFDGLTMRRLKDGGLETIVRIGGRDGASRAERFRFRRSRR